MKSESLESSWYLFCNLVLVKSYLAWLAFKLLFLYLRFTTVISAPARSFTNPDGSGSPQDYFLTLGRPLYLKRRASWVIYLEIRLSNTFYDLDITERFEIYLWM